jgi:NAD(P)H dehydrogenase (quinone)
MDQDEWVAAQITAGQAEFVARFTLTMYQAAHEGFFAGVDPLLGTLLGHEPRTVRDLLAQPAAHQIRASS